MTSILFRPENAPHDETDLEKGVPYIIIAHNTIVGNDLNEFMHKLARMRKLVFH